MKLNTEWLIAAGMRALRTAAQGVVTLVGADMINIISLDWAQILGCVATMAVLSICTSIASLPEVDLSGVDGKHVKDEE